MAKQDTIERLERLVEQQMETTKELSEKLGEKNSNPYEQAIVDAIVEKAGTESREIILTDVKKQIESYVEEQLNNLPVKIELQQEGKTIKDISGIFHYRYQDILKLVNQNIPVFLKGGAGSGKNHVLEQVAEALDLDFYFSNAITQEFKLTGFIDANGKFHETQFYKAFTNGGLFFLDEMDASIPEVLLILNSAIANKYFDFPTGRVSAHEDFRVVSAGNTMGTGADHIYVGRQQLDGATLDRFAQVEFDYDNKVEHQLSSNEDLVNFVQTLRYENDEKGLPYVFSMRAIINGSKLDGVMDDEFVVESIIFKSVPKDEISQFISSLPEGNRYTEATKNLLGVKEEPKQEPTKTQSSSSDSMDFDTIMDKLGLE
ncbi:AAA family ATPase [Staphylococcus phage vB_SauM_JDYN]|nr:AAA family ATPase [Staphylococcus phage vB_SauM_JDYN]